MILSRWFAPAILAVALGFGAVTPAPAQAQDLSRVLVDIADVVMRGDTPYYRNSNYGYDDRLVMQRDRYGRPVYYRTVPRYQSNYREGPPYGNAYGYYNNRDGRGTKCNKHGKCKTSYYDPRHDGRDDRDDDRRDDRHDHDRDDRRGDRDD